MKNFIVVVSTPEANKDAFQAAYARAKSLIADGKRVQITVTEDTDDVSNKQRRFLHGPVLTQIAEQVQVDGRRYEAAVWKEHLRRQFLPDAWKDGKRMRVSTEDLGVPGYSQYIDRVIAYATTEWGVAFQFNEHERNAVRHLETHDEA